ncbi:hypothetical protein [Halorussus sp. AFM4]|uniref:hypothetical protein n=1 Tax=Halorussus sp. AFM4 TaxID=3421651 RepID=UPI003EC0DF34
MPGNDKWTFTLSITDTNTHDLPNTDGDDSGAATNNGGEGLQVDREKTQLVKVVNTHDQDLTVNLRGSTHDDAGMAEDVQDSGGKTASASGGVAYFKTDAPWDYLRVTVSAATAPTAGDVTAVFQEG